jgi:hypothetical protein
MAKRRRRRRMRGLLLVLAIGLVAAGFLTRRMMVPRLIRHMSHRPSERPAGAVQESSRGPNPDLSGPAEHITERNRRALERVIRDKSK